MKLTVLGKYGPYAPAHGATSGYLLENGGKNLLLDMGSGVLARLQEFIVPEQLDGIIISHVHYDHINDLFLYRYMLEGLLRRERLRRLFLFLDLQCFQSLLKLRFLNLLR